MELRFPKPLVGSSSLPGATRGQKLSSFVDNAVSCGLTRAQALAFQGRLRKRARAATGGRS